MRDARLAARSWPLLVLLLGLTLICWPSARADDGNAWVWPLQPRPEVVRGFEPPPGPYASGHRGVDLAGRPGQRVVAVAAGVVQFAGLVAGTGVVVVNHGTERSTYQPVSASVSRGDTVAAGEVVGRLELGGSHCWPSACLHLGRVAGETYLDPLALLGGGPVRLLPLDAPLALMAKPPRQPPAAAALAGLRAGMEVVRLGDGPGGRPASAVLR